MSQENYYPVSSSKLYAQVLLPVALGKPYTYFVPEELVSQVKFGVRVEVQFGKSKLYAGIVVGLEEGSEASLKTKNVLTVLDEQAIIEPQQYEFWKWMASYYCCTLGEVMHAALPAGLKLSSETRIILSPIFDDNYQGLDDKEFMVTEALSIQNELTVDEIRKILDKKTVYPLLNKLLDKKIIYLKEELKSQYKPKEVDCIRLQEPYETQPYLLEDAFALLSRSNRQVEALMAFIQLSKKQDVIRKKDIYDIANVDSTVVKAIVKKGIFEIYKKTISRIGGYEEDLLASSELVPQQVNALAEIKTVFSEKNVCLLHGVTGSGKTRVYMELIREAMDRGEQVLYLLPEIALTTQIIIRLQKIFGEEIAVYHSRLNNHERVEVWRIAQAGKPIILGARSSLFLPFKNLKLIIVDESHDTSFKQNNPAPRYSGRDAAIYLAHLFEAKVLLGTATPSIESYHNAKNNKYGLVEMPERFGGVKLPEVVIVDVRQELRTQKMKSHFTSVLLASLEETLANGEQAILFQNRRGYSPTLRCVSCGWNSGCIHCDVSLTYHKFSNNLRCHYCGYQNKIPTTCPDCGDTQLSLKGFGTEKIEDDLKIFLPDAKIGRMDFDTVRSKNAHAKIINDFEEKRLDILVGTQMITKGLDFDNVGIVGVLSADHLFQFPDFRASERAFQLITQVSGRAGRKHKQGKVIIQAFNMDHPVLKEVYHNDFTSFFARELQERNEYLYPPFFRLIRISLKHKKPQILNEAAKVFTKVLKDQLGKRVIGPAIPSVPRVRNLFILDIMIKLERVGKQIYLAKQTIAAAKYKMHQEKGFSTIRVNVDVDPY
ncbi:MAG: primosomal protein N' [Saprospiraceae bacterium]